MSGIHYDIIFRGDLAPGHHLQQVKQNLQQLFKADEKKIQALFSGGAVPLKRNLDRQAAERYQSALLKAGAEVQIAEAGTVGTKTSSSNVSAKPGPKKTTTLQERLAAQTQAAEPDEVPQPSTPFKSTEPAEPSNASSSGFTLAEAGSALLAGENSEVVAAPQLDLSHYELRPQEGNLIDESEITRPSPVNVTAVDFSLGELGSDLLSDSEKNSLPLADVTPPDVELAPTGTDLGQIKPQAPPPPPDISGLSLESPDEP